MSSSEDETLYKLKLTAPSKVRHANEAGLQQQHNTLPNP